MYACSSARRVIVVERAAPPLRVTAPIQVASLVVIDP